MWGWIGEIFKWLGVVSGTKRLDFESVTARWESMYDKTVKRQDELEERMVVMQKDHDVKMKETLDERDRCRSELALQSKKLAKVEGKLETALERLEILEHHGDQQT